MAEIKLPIDRSARSKNIQPLRDFKNLGFFKLCNASIKGIYFLEKQKRSIYFEIVSVVLEKNVNISYFPHFAIILAHLIGNIFVASILIYEYLKKYLNVLIISIKASRITKNLGRSKQGRPST